MKALSIKQPYAELILQGRKKIELRKWNTHFRGEFLIHASKQPDKESMDKFEFKNLPCGMLLGKANLTSVKLYKSELDFDKDKSLHLASNLWGKYGFMLDGVKRITPIPYKGQLNFFEVKLNVN